MGDTPCTGRYAAAEEQPVLLPPSFFTQGQGSAVSSDASRAPASGGQKQGTVRVNTNVDLQRRQPLGGLSVNRLQPNSSASVAKTGGGTGAAKPLRFLFGNIPKVGQGPHNSSQSIASAPQTPAPQTIIRPDQQLQVTAPQKVPPPVVQQRRILSQVVHDKVSQVATDDCIEELHQKASNLLLASIDDQILANNAHQKDESFRFLFGDVNKVDNVPVIKRKAHRPFPQRFMTSSDAIGNEPEECHSETDSPLRKKKAFRRCIIPSCQSSERNNPSMLFFNITSSKGPRDELYRLLDDASNGNFRKPVHYSSGIYACQLHFDLENDFDAENYIIGESQPLLSDLKLKKGTIPKKVYLHNLNGVSTWLDSRPVDDPGQSVPVNQTARCLESEKIPDDDDDWPERLVEDEENEELGPLMLEAASLTATAMAEATRTVSEGSIVGSHSESLTTNSSNESEYNPSSTHSSSSNFDAAEDPEAAFRAQFRLSNLKVMQENPYIFMGIPKDAFYILELLAAKVGGKTPLEDAMLCLRKIRLMETHELLSIYFNISTSHISTILRKTLPTISKCLEECVFKPPAEKILYNLPLAFRYNYSDTTDIVDAFEVQIQKPGNALHQMLSYSTYKSCNTVKYIVSVTPDGYITFLSKGYGGRMSDVALCEESGYLKTFSPGQAVMADRGFKHLESRLDQFGVKLVRPPSVFKNAPLSSNECVKTKEVAALRIHVERVIGRLRGFAMIAPHSTVNIQMVPLLDHAVKIAAGLVNLGSPIIRV